MRVAVSISGQPRFFEEAFKYIKENILYINDCDVFFHSWHDPNKINQKYDSASWLQNSTDVYRENTSKRLLELYDPEFFIIEPQKYDLLTRDENKYPLVNGENISFRNYSMFYSMCKSLELVHSFEKSNGFEYDVICRLRFDTCPLDKIDFEKFEIHRESKEFFYTDSCRNSSVVSDWNFWSTSKNMRYISNIYNKLDDYIFNDNVLGCGEELLNHHINKLELKKCPMRISNFLIRDKDFNDKSFGRFW